MFLSVPPMTPPPLSRGSSPSLTAGAGLEVARTALAAAQSVTGAAAEVAAFITREGFSSLVILHAAGFETTLTDAGDGTVAMWADLTYLGTRQVVRFGFDFNDPLSSARRLAATLLGL